MAGGAIFYVHFDVKMDENHQGACGPPGPPGFYYCRGPCPLLVSVPSKTAHTVICRSIPAAPLRRRGLLLCTVYGSFFGQWHTSAVDGQKGAGAPCQNKALFLWESGPVSFWGHPKRNGTGKTSVSYAWPSVTRQTANGWRTFAGARNTLSPLHRRI